MRKRPLSARVAIYHTLPAASHSIGVLQRFSAHARPLRTVDRGPVGLTAWNSVVSTERGANLLATTGYAVKMVDPAGAVHSLPNLDPLHRVMEVR
ncbi:MAG: hypothetical protein K6U87_12840 [Firmicutes bacterium]|nr:hypothetical protein [Bacillota bacterium]